MIDSTAIYSIPCFFAGDFFGKTSIYQKYILSIDFLSEQEKVYKEQLWCEIVYSSIQYLKMR